MLEALLKLIWTNIHIAALEIKVINIWEDILKKDTLLEQLINELEKKAGELEKKQYELLVLKNKATFNDMDKIIELQNEINEMWAEINELADRINKLATNAKDFGLNFGEDNA